MAIRYDIGTLQPPSVLADGRMRVEGHLTRSGVFEYRNGDGTIRREFRPEAEVFRPSSLATFADVIVTDDHPNEMITAENARELGVGVLRGEPRRDGDHVAATLLINDANTIAKIKRGKVELSCGYSCDLDETPGVTPTGERYDAVQTGIKGNHIAIVAVARAGRSARMRIDAADQIPTTTNYIPTRSPMDPEKFAAAIAEANGRAAAAVTRADAADAALVAAKAAHEVALAETRAAVVTAEKALESERKARTDAAESDKIAIRARLALEAQATPFLPEGSKVEEMSDREIHVAVVKRIDGDDVPADEHDAYARALFTKAVQRATKADAAVDAVRFVAGSEPSDGKSEAEKAYAEMLERNRNLSQSK